MGQRKLWDIILAVIIGVLIIMAIHDVDKTQDNRGLPLPNASDATMQRNSDGTTAITNKLDASGGQFVSTKDGAVIVNDGTSNIGLFGPDSNGETVVKIAKPGFDARTAVDENLIFNSNYNMFKIIGSGTTTLTPTNSGSPLYSVAAGGYSVTVPFTGGTGYPGVVAYFKFPFDITSGSYTVYTTQPQALPYYAALSAARLGSLFYSIGATSITFYYNQFTAIDFGVVPNIEFTYYLLQETAN